MKTKKLFIACLTIVITIVSFSYYYKANAIGTTYYVDSSIPDTNVASSTPDCRTYNPSTFDCSGGSASAYKTIADVNSKSFSADDHILFRKGQTWREQLIVPASGTSGHPITFGSFGTGSQPIISGSDLKTTWSLESIDTEDFSDGRGAKPVSWWEFTELSGPRLDSNTTHNNTLSESGGAIARTTGPNAQIPYGASFISASSQLLTRADKNLSSGFPGKNGIADLSVTFGAWVKVNRLGTTQGIMEKRSSYYLLVAGDGQVFVASFGDGFSRFTQVFSGAQNTITAGEWVHVAGRWSQGSGDLDLFVNGVLVKTGSLPNMLQSGNPLDIGKADYSGDKYLNGSVAEPFVFNSALTNHQIVDIYAGSIGGHSGDVYYTSVTTGDPHQVLEDGARLTEVSSQSALVGGSFWYDSVASRVYIRTLGDDDPSGHVIEVGARDYGVRIAGKSNITLTDLNLRAAREHGIFPNGQFSNLVVDQVTGEWNYGAGWLANEPTATITSVLIQDSTFQYNGASGIDMSVDNWAGWLIYQNALNYNSQLPGSDDSNNAHEYSGGLKLFSLPQTGGSGSIVSNNIAHDNGVDSDTVGVGIWIDTATGVTVTRNITYNNQGPGIMMEKTIDSVASYNIAYNNTRSAIRHARDDSVATANIWITAGLANGIAHSSGNHIYNNLSYGGWWGIANMVYYGNLADGSNISNNTFKNNIAIEATRYNFVAINGGDNDTSHGSGNVYDHNAFGAQAGDFVAFTTAKSTYADLESAYGSAMHNVQTDPLLTNPGSASFTLQSSSPVIDAGVTLGSAYDDGLSSESAWPFGIVTVDQDLYGEGWEMGPYVCVRTLSPSAAPFPSRKPIPPDNKRKLMKNNGTNWLIPDGLRRGVTNPGILNSYGFESEDAVKASDSDIPWPYLKSASGRWSTKGWRRPG